MEVYKDKYLTTQSLKKIKLTNPLLKVLSLRNYEGNDLTNYDWIRQKNNYEQFLGIIQKFGIDTTYIYSAKWSSHTARIRMDKTIIDEDMDSKINHHAFILLTSNPHLIWERTDKNEPGLSYNWVYYKDKKMKLTDFFKMTEEEIRNMLEEDE